MNRLEEKIATYIILIKKLGDSNILAEIKKLQEEAKSASKRARDLYAKFIKEH
jgi:hypothetical protein